MFFFISSLLVVIFAFLTPVSLSFPVVAIVGAIIGIYRIRKKSKTPLLKMAAFIFVLGLMAAILNMVYYGLPIIGDVDMIGQP
ncbi:hypothetical protein P4641_15510 [Halalkalibacterium halodurans]|uniref:hypothetical protein n=1 Tax=Halalkalibacterium halodurans TaxID=86665 RepID=UPI002E1C0E95|nr:hypothetical protein [Halalkalibacterium halodurans]